MGACCSISDSEYESNDEENYIYPRRGELPRNLAVPSLTRAYYGEFICHGCGRYWSSTLTWYNCAQQCQDCDTNVQPRNQRKVRPGDLKRNTDNSTDHMMELCQKCQELGYHCGTYNRRAKRVLRRGRRR